MVQTDFVEVAKVNEIPDGKMEVDRKEVLIASTLKKYGLRY